jgi:hypothetical protein
MTLAVVVKDRRSASMGLIEPCPTQTANRSGNSLGFLIKVAVFLNAGRR